MARKTPPHPSYSAWTTARFWSFVRSALRRAWSRWPPKYEILKDNYRPAPEGLRHKKEYQCAICKEWFQQKHVEVDHIVPCGSLNDYHDLPRFVENLFVSKEKLRVVCVNCHKKLTYEYRKNKNV